MRTFIVLIMFLTACKQGGGSAASEAPVPPSDPGFVGPGNPDEPLEPQGCMGNEEHQMPEWVNEQCCQEIAAWDSTGYNPANDAYAAIMPYETDFETRSYYEFILGTVRENRSAHGLGGRRVTDQTLIFDDFNTGGKCYVEVVDEIVVGVRWGAEILK